MRKLSTIMALAGAAIVSVPSLAGQQHHRGSTRYRKGHKPTRGNYSPTINRWTGKPHEHKQEIARRLRQKKA